MSEQNKRPMVNVGTKGHIDYGKPVSKQEKTLKMLLSEADLPLPSPYGCAYFHEYLARYKKFAETYAKAATAEANKRIAALESEVAELKEENHNLNWALGTDGYEQMATPEQQLEYTEGLKNIEARISDMKYRKDVITELQANNHDLREALEDTTERLNEIEKDSTLIAGDIKCIARNRKLLEATPPESLAKHEYVSVCEECNVNMHPFSHDGISGYSCDSCGWSVDDMKGK